MFIREICRFDGTWRNVLDEGNSSIFVADDQVQIAVSIPVEGDGNNHLKFHLQYRTVGSRQRLSPRVTRFTSSSDVFEIRETVEKFTADQVQIAICVKVTKIGRRTAECIDRLSVCQNFLWWLIVG